MAEFDPKAGKTITSCAEAANTGLSGDAAKAAAAQKPQSTKDAGSTNQLTKIAGANKQSSKFADAKRQSTCVVEKENRANETTSLAANLANTLPRTSPSSLPRDLERIWLSATGLLPDVDSADIPPELRDLQSSFVQARLNLAADIEHESQVSAASEQAHRRASGGLIASEQVETFDILAELEAQVPNDQTDMPLVDEPLPPLLTNPQQTLIVSLLRAAFEAEPETLRQLLFGAPCTVFEVPAGIDVKAVARVLPVLFYGPNALTIGLNELLPSRVKPRCFVHWIAEDIDNYNGRSNGLLHAIRSNLLRAADFGVPVLVVKSADVALPEPIAAVFSARMNLPSLTITMVDDVIELYANVGLANTELANAELVNAGLVSTNPTDAGVGTGLASGSLDSCNDVTLNTALDADPRDLSSLGTFAIGAMIQRGAAAKDMIERIKGKLAAYAKARLELEAEQAAEREAETSTTARGTLKISKLENGKLVPVTTHDGKSAIDKLNVPVFSPSDLSDPAIPRLEDLAGYGPAGDWGLELTRDIADYKDGTIGWSEIDRGLVLVGPPGVGKTIFAKSLAKSADMSFIASSFIKWESKRGDGHGDVVKTMAEHFLAATRCAPCIMLLDEIDSIPDRGTLDERSRSWWVSLVNATLEQLDGSLSREGVIVIGACNDASRLDPALVRSGRLEKVIHIPYPSTADLARIFRFHLKDDLPGFDPIGIAEGLVGFTGADVETAVRAARRTARREQRELKVSDLDDALFGEETISEYQLWRTAVHEAGHAIAATALNLEPVDFISIRMRGQSGGFVRLGNVDDNQTGDKQIGDKQTDPHKTHTSKTGNKTKKSCPNPYTRNMVLARVAQALAGRAAETIILGAPDTGSGGSKSSDLAIATQLLGQTHCQHGLGREGNLVWHPPLAPAKPWPSDVAASIGLDLSEQQKRAEVIIVDNSALIIELAETLMQTKTMNGEVFASNFAARVQEEPDKEA